MGPWAAHDDISVQAVYLDDLMSGWQLLNNSFEDCQVALFIGGEFENQYSPIDSAAIGVLAKHA